jgi:poly(3-hydroxybutyrate) depolymerase
MSADLRGRSKEARRRARDEEKAPRRSSFCVALLALLVCYGQALPVRASEALPPLGAALEATSVSGLSSGAYMAGQIQLAHAKDIVGAGIVAGGPFACAESAAGRLVPYWPTAVMQNAQKALHGCMLVDWGTPDPVGLADRAKELASAGELDPLTDLAADKVYLYSGSSDRTVMRPVVEAAKQLYLELGVPKENIALVEGEGGHGFLTEDAGEACALTDKPYVNDCDYDQAKAILEWIYGPLATPSAEPKGRQIVFDQSDFAETGTGLAPEGVVYLPEVCAEAGASCRLHIVLHGCEQSRETVGDTLIKDSGFEELADTNRLIVLFPQIKASVVNPNGCWDWWGYTGLDYLGNDAPQIKAIWSMVERLAERP